MQGRWGNQGQKTWQSPDLRRSKDKNKHEWLVFWMKMQSAKKDPACPKEAQC
jgi:hypothetical protein